eukprot:6472813-Ditylum_brightwellii.AAC.2
MEWYDNVLPMQPSHDLTLSDFLERKESYSIQLEDELFGKDWLHSYAIKILNAKYEFTDVINVVNRQDHLTQSQKIALLSCYGSINKCFMVHLEGTLIRKFILTSIKMPCQYTLGPTVYHPYTSTPLKGSPSIKEKLEC